MSFLSILSKSNNGIKSICITTDAKKTLKIKKKYFELSFCLNYGATNVNYSGDDGTIAAASLPLNIVNAIMGSSSAAATTT